MNLKNVSLFLSIVGSIGVVELAGCSHSTQPSASLGQTADPQSSVAASITSDESAMAKLSGIPIDSSDGEFCIGWNQFVGPTAQGGTRIGDASVMVLDTLVSSTGQRWFCAGEDVGSVYLNYAGNHQEFEKHQPRFGGTFYSIFPRLFDQASTGVTFSGNAPYEFEVTGSAVFSAGKFSIDSPPDLISITNHTNGEQVNGDSDLVLVWTGGNPAGNVLVRVTPMILFGPEGFAPCDSNAGPDNRGRGGIKPGGPMGGHGGMPPGIRNGDPGCPMSIDTGYVVLLPNNPGRAVIAAAAIQQILDGAPEISVTVSEIISSEFSHDHGKYRIVMRDGDRRMLIMK